MEIFILGSGGMMPMPHRFLSSFLIRRDNDSSMTLLDCGEGTQIQLKRMGLSWKPIDKILISHTHADHVTGLPGLMMLMTQAERTEPLDIYGPPRIADYIDSVRVLEPKISYPVRVHELRDEGAFFEGEDYTLECRWLEHSRPCMGYRLSERPRPGVFDVARAEELGVPNGPERARLVNGEPVTLADERVVRPEDVVGPPRPGLAVAYVTDTRPCAGARALAAGADIFICESMYVDAEAEGAADKKHMTAAEAAKLAVDADARRLLLTHVSPRYIGNACRDLQDEARAIFPKTRLARDLQTVTLRQRG